MEGLAAWLLCKINRETRKTHFCSRTTCCKGFLKILDETRFLFGDRFELQKCGCTHGDLAIWPGHLAGLNPSCRGVLCRALKHGDLTEGQTPWRSRHETKNQQAMPRGHVKMNHARMMTWERSSINSAFIRTCGAFMRPHLQRASGAGSRRGGDSSTRLAFEGRRQHSCSPGHLKNAAGQERH